MYHIYPETPPYPRVLIYDVLSALGYRVGIFSSQNESWQGMKNYLDTGNVDRFLDSETYDGPTYVPPGDKVFEDWLREAGKSGKIDDRHTVAEAIDWIDESHRPFVIYMNLQNSHVPYVVPPDFDPPYGSGRVSFPIRFASFPRDSVQAVKDLYSSSLAYVDAQLTRLVDFLEETGRLDNTIVVLTSDTGQAFYEHEFASHGSALYDEVMRTPLIIQAPGLEPGDEAGLSQHIDVPPTVLALLGLPPHPSFQGRDLLTPMTESADDPTVYLVGQVLVEQYAIVRDRWKLIFDARTRSYELFDLHSDPKELENVSSVHPDTVTGLAARLHGWRKAQLDYYSNPAAYRTRYPPRLLGIRSERP
jgi:arylsulfatase A-like enzyme